MDINYFLHFQNLSKMNESFLIVKIIIKFTIHWNHSLKLIFELFFPTKFIVISCNFQDKTVIIFVLDERKKAEEKKYTNLPVYRLTSQTETGI